MNVYPFTGVAVRAMEILHGARDERMRLRDLAKALGLDTATLRREIENLADLERPWGDDFIGTQFIAIGPEWDDLDAVAPPPSDDDWVELLEGIETAYGTNYFDADILGPLCQAADDLLEEEPDNDILAGAIERLRERFLPGLRPIQSDSDIVGSIARAIAEGKKMRILYARMWKPGVTDRVIEPYKLIRTFRGVEVDAGPVQDDGDIRTFVVDRIRDFEVLDEPSAHDPDIEDIQRRHRAPMTVRGVVPNGSKWLVEDYAEAVRFFGADSEDVEFEADLLPPVAERVAIILIAEPRAFVVGDPFDSLRDEVAHRLLEHHGL